MPQKKDAAPKPKRSKTKLRLTRDNGKKGRRTPAQLDRQERIYMLHLMDGLTHRQIAAREKMSLPTVVADIKAEAERRAAEIAARRATETARAVAYYETVAADARRKGQMYDGLAKNGGKVTDRTLDAQISARERIDKLLGIEAPTKVELGLDALLDALKPE